jgi:hypothetical protein
MAWIVSRQTSGHPEKLFLAKSFIKALGKDAGIAAKII